MARVMAEYVFVEPFTDDRMAETSRKVDPCLTVRNGLWRRSSLGSDRLRMACEFEAPDAESVREAFQSAGVRYERIWAADVHAIEDYPEMMDRHRAMLDAARVMAEHTFDEPLTDDRFADASKTLEPCLQVRNGVWRRSAISHDRLRMVCEFGAPDAESVREALRAAGVPYERVWSATVYKVEDYPARMERLRALLAGSSS